MRNRAVRSLIVVLSLAAWFALSNHCALAVTESDAQWSGCPMHSAPAKKKPAPKPVCCKDVRAVVAKSVKAGAAAMLVALPAKETRIVPAFRQIALAVEALDTGPPSSLSFAESVLQESMLSHAPPVS